jgi:hypothetical protein
MNSILKIIKYVLRKAGINSKETYRSFFSWSVNCAIKEQGLDKCCLELRKIIPDISNQYTHGFSERAYGNYFEVKMRGLHAFQVNACIKAVDHVYKKIGRPITIADIGDSSGHHLRYLRKIIPKTKFEKGLSVNLDPVAIEKINAGGGEAILCRAEELDTLNILPDLSISFEMLEHLTDPARFLHNLAENGSADNLLISVPYRKKSQFGGSHLRLDISKLPNTMSAEDVHIYEFSIDDWLLLAKFSGWSPVFTKVYWQYPRSGIGRLMQPFWRETDFEGFFVMFLKRELSFSRKYTGW